ncbi:Ribosome-binding protein 1 [Microtus ochrogaster]|uniref:Ribosome-binding protein 1 n=1 Tax=Microtus ochrogaster TaxID=79684 RepID=A0A8J6H3N4_MICOH|nr:Ribosome-binding protein 1 [Microtus ochrogaster]
MDIYDTQTLGVVVFGGFMVVSAIGIFLVSTFSMKETSYEEALANQRKEMAKTHQQKGEKKKKEKTVEKKGKTKKKEEKPNGKIPDHDLDPNVTIILKEPVRVPAMAVAPTSVHSSMVHTPVATVPAMPQEKLASSPKDKKKKEKKVAKVEPAVSSIVNSIQVLASKSAILEATPKEVPMVAVPPVGSKASVPATSNQGKKGEGAQNQTKKGDGAQNQSKKGDGAQNQAKKGEGAQNQAKKGEGAQNQAKKGDGVQNQAKKGEGAQNQAKKGGEGAQNQAKKGGEGAQNQGKKGETNQNQSKKGEGGQNQAKKGEGAQNQAKKGEGPQNQGKKGEATQNQGKKMEGAQNQGKKTEGTPNQGKKGEGTQNQAKKLEGSPNQGKKAEGVQNQGKKGEGAQNQGKKGEGAQNQGKKGEGAQNQGKKGEGSPNQSTKVEVIQNQGRKAEGTPNQGKKVEGPQNQGKKGEGAQNQTKKGEGAQNQGKKGEGPQNQGKKAEGAQSQSKKGEGTQNQGKKGDGNPNQGKKGEGAPNQSRKTDAVANQGTKTEGVSNQGKKAEGAPNQGKKELESQVSCLEKETSELKEAMEQQKGKNNDLREKNWKAMEALALAERACEEKLRSLTQAKEESEKQLHLAEAQTKEVLLALLPDLSISAHQNYAEWLREVKEKGSELLKKPPASVEPSLDIVSKLREAEETQNSLQAECDQYRTILAETEGMLKDLQKSVEEEERVWKAKVGAAEEELQKSQVTVKHLEDIVEKLKGELENSDQVREHTSLLEAELEKHMAAASAECQNYAQEVAGVRQQLSDMKSHVEDGDVAGSAAVPPAEQDPIKVRVMSCPKMCP